MKQMKRGHYQEDEFQNIMHRVMRLVVRHRDTSIMIGVGVVVAIALLIVFLPRREIINPEAELMLTQAISLIDVGRIDEAEGILVETAGRFANTHAGKVSKYYLGVIKHHRGSFSEAVEHFNSFLRSTKKDYLLIPSALLGAGNAAEGLKDYPNALKFYQRLIKNRKSPFYFQGLLAYGRTLGLTGEKTKAREILKELIDKEPPPEIISDARFYIGYFSE